MSLPRCVRCGHAGSRPLLAGFDRLYRTTAERFSVVSCTHCGMARLSRFPDPERFAQYYPSNYWFDPSGSAPARLAETYRRLVLRDHAAFVRAALRRSPGTLLDVGAGGGLLARMLRETGFHALAFDLSPQACSLAWNTNRVPAVAGDFERHPFRSESFAAISLFHVLEHLSDPAAYLAIARSLLVPRGRLIAQVPNRASWQASVLGARWNGNDIPRHLQHFRFEDLAALVHQNGFRIARVKYFSWRDNPAGLATSLAPSLDPMARRIRRLPSAWPHFAAYLGLTALALPFAALEAFFGRGSTVMIEAVKT